MPYTGSLTRTRGRLSPSPLSFFFADSEKTAERSAAKFSIAFQPTIWHISKKTMTRWPQRSSLQFTLSDLTSSCIFRSLTSCQRHTSDPNSLKLAVFSKDIYVCNLYISDFLYRWPLIPVIPTVRRPAHCCSISRWKVIWGHIMTSSGRRTFFFCWQ